MNNPGGLLCSCPCDANDRERGTCNNAGWSKQSRVFSLLPTCLCMVGVWCAVSLLRCPGDSVPATHVVLVTIDVHHVGCSLGAATARILHTLFQLSAGPGPPHLTELRPRQGRKWCLFVTVVLFTLSMLPRRSTQLRGFQNQHLKHLDRFIERKLGTLQIRRELVHEP